MSALAVFLSSVIPLGIFVIFCIVTDLIAYIRKKRLIKPVEFFPPEGFSPLDVALVYSGRGLRTNYILNPLLLYWLDKGYVSLEEDGRGFKVTCLKTPPSFEKSGRVNEETYLCEMAFFMTMFPRGTDRYYTLAARKTVREMYDKTAKECKKLSRSVVNKTGKRISLVMMIVSAVLAIYVGIVSTVCTHGPAVAIMIFPLIGSFLIRFMSEPPSVRVPFMLVWGGVPFLAVFLFPMPALVRIAFVSAVVVLVLTINLFAEKADFREGEDLKTYAKVCSFKRFLVVADKKRLELLVEQYPRYFYDVLPYFYVFGITKKMKSKFDQIVPDGSLRQLGGIRDVFVD